jgi:hypothetical protein
VLGYVMDGFKVDPKEREQAPTSLGYDHLILFLTESLPKLLLGKPHSHKHHINLSFCSLLQFKITLL